MTAAIEVAHLVKRYRGATGNAVDDISFEVRAGAFFCLLGPNGAGKTTTISILTTTLEQTSGLARIAGLDVSADQAGVRREIGAVFQQPALDQNLTAEENLTARGAVRDVQLAAPVPVDVGQLPGPGARNSRRARTRRPAWPAGPAPVR